MRVGVPGGRGQHRPGPRRHHRVRVDLPVRVVQRHADLHAPVLEREDLRHAGQRRQLGGPVGERVDARYGPAPAAAPPKDAVVVAGEADHLAASHARADRDQLGHLGDLVGRDPVAERRELVLEDHHVVVGRRDLAGVVRGGRAQRALVGRRQEGAGLPVRGDRHPLVDQRVVAAAGRSAAGAAAAGRPDGAAVGVVPLVEVDQLAAVGQPDRCPLRAVIWSRSPPSGRPPARSGPAEPPRPARRR